MRVAVCTWNAAQYFQEQSPLDFSSWLEESTTSKKGDRGSDEHEAPAIYAVGFQETVLLPYALIGLGAAQLSRYEDGIKHDIEKHAATSYGGSRDLKYKLVKKVVMGAIALFIYAEEAVADRIDDVLTAYVGCGPANMSNKGAVGIRFSLKNSQTSWTFLSAHLAAYDKDKDIERRNEDWRSIISQLIFEDRGTQYQIYDTSYLFVMGDLNYRISTKRPQKLTTTDVKKRIDGDVTSLLKHDQLRHEQEAGRTMHSLAEGKITFPPSYKFLKGTDQYKEFSKRIPGWCDRILHAGHDEVQVVHYCSVPKVTLSDHKPVKALYKIQDSPSAASSSQERRLPSRSPYPMDNNRVTKQLLGLAADKTVGSIWSLLLLLGRGNVWLGAGFILFVAVAEIYGLDYRSVVRKFW